MKKISSILFFCFLFLTANAFKNTENLSQNYNERINIFLINSYPQDYIWSTDLIQEIEKKLYKQYPGAYIYTGSIDASDLLVASSYLFSFRKIFLSFSKKENDSLYYRLSYTDIFESNIGPDVIIFLGDEALLFYQTFCHVIPKQWIDIPVVWTCTADSVITNYWNSSAQHTNFSHIGIPEDRINIKVKIRQKTISTFPKEIYQYVIDTNYNDSTFLIERHYNHLTGVKTPLQIKKNLQLIQKLCPDVNEIVFIEEGIYTTDYVRRTLEQEIPKTLPDAAFTPVKHLKNINTDSLFHLMTHPVKGKVILVHSFNIDGYYSRNTEFFVDSLFQHSDIAPIFSLTNRSFSKKDKYIVGGYYLETDSIITNTFNLIHKTLTEKNTFNNIPFQKVDQGRPVLNKTMTNRLGMTKRAKELPNVVFYNLPPSFFKKYEVQIWVALITLAVIIVVLFFAFRQRSYNKKLMNDFLQYKNLYTNLQLIYNYSALSFNLYEKDGSYHKSNLNENTEKPDYINEIFCENIFESQFLTPRERTQLKTGQAIFKEIEIKYSGTKTFQYIIKPVDNKGFISIVLDTSLVSAEQKQKESLMSLLEFVFDASSIGILFYDIETNNGYASQKWISMMNENRVSFPPSYKIFTKEDQIFIQNFVRNIQFVESPQHLKREVLVLQENQENCFQLQIFNIPERKLIVELCIDITKQKQNEARLEIAKQEAEFMNIEMKEFLANISHEIRTPLNAIVGFSEILINEEIPDNQILFSKIIETNNVLLVDIIENVLKLSEIDSGSITKLESQYFEAICILSNIAASIHFRMEKKRVTIINEFEEKEVWINTSLIYFNQLMLNLILNAAKFTQENGTITIGCKKENDKHVFYVKDTGIGISEEQKPLIFKRFYKIDTFSQGTGLGLSLCKSIADLLKGELTFESELGKGSTFRFKF